MRHTLAMYFSLMCLISTLLCPSALADESYDIAVSRGTTFYIVDPFVEGRPEFSQYSHQLSFLPAGQVIKRLLNYRTGNPKRVFMQSESGEVGFLRKDDTRIQSGPLLNRIIVEAKAADLALYMMKSNVEISKTFWFTNGEGPYFGTKNVNGEIYIVVCRDFHESKFRQIELEIPNIEEGKFFRTIIGDKECIATPVPDNTVARLNLDMLGEWTPRGQNGGTQYIVTAAYPVVVNDALHTRLVDCGAKVEIERSETETVTLTGKISAAIGIFGAELSYAKAFQTQLREKITYPDNVLQTVRSDYLIEPAGARQFVFKNTKRMQGCASDGASQDYVYLIDGIDTVLDISDFLKTYKASGVLNSESKIVYHTSGEYYKISGELLSFLDARMHYRVSEPIATWMLRRITRFVYVADKYR